MSNPRVYDAAMRKKQSTPPPTEKFDRLKAILREMFQLDRGDLREVIGAPSQRSENRWLRGPKIWVPSVSIATLGL